MAVNRGDKLAKALGGIETDKRFTNWLWLYLKNLIPSSNLGDFGSFFTRDRMAEAITSHNGIRQKIESERGLYLVPKESLNWITNDKRQFHWVTRKVAERNGPLHITGTTSLTYRDLAIATIDIWSIPFAEKLSAVIAIASEWNAQEKADKIFEWLYGQDERAKLELAWKMASNSHQLLTIHQTPWHETADMIVAMDTWLPSFADKKLFIDSIKKRWSQNKHRAKTTGKKQCNFILSEKAIDRLQKLADRHELKRAQILEILLQMEEEKGIYISERLKVLKNI